MGVGWFFLGVLLLLPAVKAMYISEIMAAPVADDTLNEWVELYNNGTETIDVAGWVIGDSKDNDTLEGGLYDGSGTVLLPGQFALITDDATRVYNNFNVSETAVKLYIDDASIGNGLSNEGETLSLYDADGLLIDSIAYSGVESGSSVVVVNDSGKEALPTPGFHDDGTAFSVLDSDSCDWKVYFLLNQTSFIKEEFNFKIRAEKIFGDATELTATATLHDAHGNVIKEYRPFTEATATRKKTSRTYSPSLAPSLYLLSTTLNTECNEQDTGNNDDQVMFSIANDDGTASSIDIENILDLGSDKKASFGDVIRVRLSVYKGDTTKKTVKLWIEDDERVTKIASVNVEEPFTLYKLTLPLQIASNCDEKYEDGRYDVVVEGLDARAEKSITLEHDEQCFEAETESAPRPKKFVYELVDFSGEIDEGDNLLTHLQVDNNDDTAHDFTVWSYVFRGPKSYSGERESNKQTISLSGESSTIVALENMLEEVDAGEYKLKVKILKDTLKTPTEITEPITIKEGEKISKENEPLLLPQEKEHTEGQPERDPMKNRILTAEVVYESTSLKAKQLVHYFFASVLVLLCVVLVLKQ